MKLMIVAVLVMAFGLSACEVNTPQGAPGPAGSKGESGATGATGAQGTAGKPASNTVVVVPPQPKPDAK